MTPTRWQRIRQILEHLPALNRWLLRIDFCSVAHSVSLVCSIKAWWRRLSPTRTLHGPPPLARPPRPVFSSASLTARSLHQTSKEEPSTRPVLALAGDVKLPFWTRSSKLSNQLRPGSKISWHHSMIVCQDHDLNSINCLFRVEASVLPEVPQERQVDGPQLVSSKDDEVEESNSPLRRTGRAATVYITSTSTIRSTATSFSFTVTTYKKQVTLGTGLLCLPSGWAVC